MAKATEAAKQSDESVIEEPKTEEPVKRKMPVRVERVVMDGNHEGWAFMANRDFTYGELEELLTTNYARMIAILRKLVISWEGFVDREGELIAFVEDSKLPPEGAPIPEGSYNPWHNLSGSTLVHMCRSIAGLVTLPNS